MFSVNRKTGKILRTGDRGGSKIDYFNVGATNNDGGFVTDQTISSERGAGSINSFRFTDSSESTISAFVIPGEGITGFFLEPAGSSTAVANQNRRIPEGAYSLEPFSGATKKDVFRLSNDQVSKERHILIHIGNKPIDTAGCLLTGCSYMKDWVSNSGDKLKEIRGYIDSVGAEKVRLKIYNVIPDDEQK